MSRKTFEQMMSLFAATWPERAPTPDTLLAYWMALSHVDDTVFQQAARQCLQTCTFYPKPAEILSRVTAILDASGVLPASPQQAWAEALKLARWHERESDVSREIGYDGLSRMPAKPTMSNAEIERAVREMGGSATLYGLSERELPYRRKEFMDIYERFRTQRIESDPDILGQPLPPPKPPELDAGDEENPLMNLVRDIERGAL